MFLNPRHQKKVKVVWGIISVLIVISMIMLYVYNPAVQ